MAQQTKREHLEERLASLKDKMAAELAKANPADQQLQDLRDSIDHTEATLAENGPDLDRPHKFNWGAVG